MNSFRSSYKQNSIKAAERNPTLSAEMYPPRYRTVAGTKMGYAVGETKLFAILLVTVFLKTSIVEPTASPSQLQVPPQESNRLQSCSFNGGGRVYNISDLLQCMNELASSAITQGSQSRSLEDADHLIRGFPGGGRPYPPLPPYPGLTDGDSFPQLYDVRPGGPVGSPQYQGQPIQPQDFQGPGFYPPPPGVGYPNPLGIGFNPMGGPGISLFEALSSIAQYDDHKCIPRLLCEVATGVVPGSGTYKQTSSTLEEFGKNTLIGLLTALDFGETSPVLGFAKSALLGYTSRGNPSICYQEYVKCPRNPNDLVHYLNNHNGGFFRFFSNIGNTGSPQGSYQQSGSNGYGLARKEPAPPPGLSGPESDRTGTGELKFDNPDPSSRQDYGKSFFPELRSRNESTKFVFPNQEKTNNQPPLNRVSKSLTSFPPGYYQDALNGYQGQPQMNPPFFPQDGKDQEANMLYQPLQSSGQQQKQNSQMMGKARLYMPDGTANSSSNSFTFPDGQKVKINVAFSKLFTEGYKKALRRSFSSDQFPHPTSFDGFNMLNLADVFPDEKGRPELQLGHPCDMICHDNRGTAVQFSQALSNTGALNTLMSPDRPILDLSRPVPCEVMCVDRRGERRQSSTVLNQVLRPSIENAIPQQSYQDMWQDRKMMLYNSMQPQHPMGMGMGMGIGMQFGPNLAALSAQSNFQALQQLQQSVHQQGLQSLQQQVQQQSGQQSNTEEEVPTQRAPKANRDEKTEKQESGVRAPKSRYSREGEKYASPEKLRRDNINNNNNAGAVKLVRRQGSVMGNLPYINIAIGSPMAGGPTQFHMGQVPLQGMIPPLGVMSMPMIPIPIGQAPVSYTSSVMNPCARGGCPKDVQSYSVQILTMCGGIIYLLPPNMLALMPICAVKLRTCTTCNNMKPTTIIPGQSSEVPIRTSTTPEPITTTTPKWVDPGGKDYPLESCLIGESWSVETLECVPIKFDKDAEAEYAHVPGMHGNRASGNAKKLTRTHKNKKKKKLIIITDQGNITYIKAT